VQEQVWKPIVRWHLRKARANLRKHGVSFEEAATVVEEPLSVTKPDPDHSETESRFLTLGLSFKHRLLLLAHTEDPDEMRIITARLPTQSERYAYEDE